MKNKISYIGLPWVTFHIFHLEFNSSEKLSINEIKSLEAYAEENQYEEVNLSIRPWEQSSVSRYIPREDCQLIFGNGTPRDIHIDIDAQIVLQYLTRTPMASSSSVYMGHKLDINALYSAWKSAGLPKQWGEVFFQEEEEKKVLKIKTIPNSRKCEIMKEYIEDHNLYLQYYFDTGEMEQCIFHFPSWLRNNSISYHLITPKYYQILRSLCDLEIDKNQEVNFRVYNSGKITLGGSFRYKSPSELLEKLEELLDTRKNKSVIIDLLPASEIEASEAEEEEDLF